MGVREKEESGPDAESVLGPLFLGPAAALP